MRLRASVLLAAALATALAMGAASPSLAKGSLHGSVRVIPAKVRVGTQVKLVGSHLPANTYFALIITVPNTSKSPWRQFIPTLAKSDRHGNMRVQFRMPVLPLCGPASLYVYAARSSAALRASLTLTGCKAPNGPPPPAPPGKKKHK